MESSLDHAGLPADDHSRTPNTESVTNNNNNLANAGANATLAYPHLRPAPNGHGQFVPSLGLSPPQEPTLYQPQPQEIAPSTWGNKHLGSPISFSAELNHPPTPPNDDFNPLLQWQAQENAKAIGSSAHLPSRVAPAKSYVLTAEQQRYVEPYHPLPPPQSNAYSSHNPTTFAPPYLGFPTPLHTETLQGRQPHYGANAFESQNYHHPQQYDLMGQPYGLHQRQPSHTGNRESYAAFTGVQPQLPAITNLLQAPHIHSQYNVSSAPARTVQHWPTANLRQNKPNNITPPRQTAEPDLRTITTGPSPGYDGKSRIDRRTCQKQEAFRRKAAATRQQRQSIAALNDSAAQPRPCKPSTSTSTKRKRTTQLSDFAAPTLPPPMRSAPVPGYYEPVMSQYPQPNPLTTKEQSQQGVSLGLQEHAYQPIMLDESHAPSQKLKSPSSSSPVDWDVIEQPLVTNYEDYKWSVTLYEIDRNGQFAFAQSWFEQLFEMNLKSDEYKWHTHTTTGYIKDGDRFSLLVLHNAANPFEWGMPPDVTTSIGVYGRHWYEHNEVHWMTFAPDIRWLLKWCEDRGGITMRRKWNCTMTKASDKRFHRAYWLAANQQHLGGLLNHGGLSDKPHNAVEDDSQDDFEITEEDLTCAWTVTADDAEQAWRRILQANEDYGHVPDEGYEHVVTGCSEWIEFGTSG
jgi:hypothetical protein